MTNERNNIRWLPEGRFYKKNNEKKGNDVKWNYFEVDAFITI